MAVRDGRSDVKQTTAGFRVLLMVQSLTSAKSKFLSPRLVSCDGVGWGDIPSNSRPENNNSWWKDSGRLRRVSQSAATEKRLRLPPPPMRYLYSWSQGLSEEFQWRDGIFQYGKVAIYGVTEICCAVKPSVSFTSSKITV